MTNRKIRYLSQSLNELCIKCSKKVIDGKLNVKTKVTGGKNPGIVRILSDDSVNKLNFLFKYKPEEFINEIIDNNVSNKLITGFESDRELELPMGLVSKDKFLVVETAGLKIYFNKLACQKYNDIVLKLEERSKQDCFTFIKERLEATSCMNLNFNISSNYNISNDTRRVYTGNDGCKYIYKSLNYDIGAKSKDNVSSIDIQNMMDLIDIHSSIYGQFEGVSFKNNTINFSNHGSIIIGGVEEDSEVYSKVYRKFITR